MNKKLLTIGISVALSGVLIGSSAFAAMPNDSGYDVYKAAFKNTLSAESMTPHIQLSVKDNGNALLSVDSLAKMDKTTQSMSGEITVTAGDLQKTADVFRQNGETIIKDSQTDTYKVINNNGRQHFHGNFQKDSVRAKAVENIIDAVAGKFQDDISLNNNSDGTKEVSLQLSGSQVPPVLNTVVSTMVKKAESNHSKHMASEYEKDMQNKVPHLVDNIKVSNVDIKATINQANQIVDQVENITITGTDAEGVQHEVVISAHASFSNFNSTTPDKVDLTGKQVQQIENLKEMRK